MALVGRDIRRKGRTPSKSVRVPFPCYQGRALATCICCLTSDKGGLELRVVFQIIQRFGMVTVKGGFLTLVVVRNRHRDIRLNALVVDVVLVGRESNAAS